MTFSREEVLPGKVQLEKCVETSNTPEAAKHLVVQVEGIVAKSRTLYKSPDLTDKAQAVIKELKRFLELVEMAHAADGKNWDGKEIADSPLGAMHEEISKRAADFVNAAVGEKIINFDFAISPKAEIVRAFTVDGQPLETKVLEGCDDMLNGFSVKKKMAIKTGILHQTDDKGVIKDILADVDLEGVKELFSEEFPNYAEARGVAIRSILRDFPIQEIIEQAQKFVDQSTEAVISGPDTKEMAETRAAEEAEANAGLSSGSGKVG